MVSVSLFLLPAQVPLQPCPPTFDPCPQFGISHRLAESALCPVIQVIYEVIKQHSSEY